MMAGLLDDLIADIDRQHEDKGNGSQEKGNPGAQENNGVFGEYSPEFNEYAKETAVGSEEETGEKGPGKDNEQP